MTWASLTQAQAASDDATRAVARELGVEGIQAFQTNDLTTADQKLDRAYRLFAAPTLGLWSARSRAKLGRWVEAAERYRQVMQVSPPGVGELEAQRSAQTEAAQELKDLLPRIPTLTLVLEGADESEVKVLLNNSPYPSDMFGIARPTNPGVHRLLATRSGERVEQTVELKEKEQRTVPLTFRAPSLPQPQPQPIAAAQDAEPRSPNLSAQHTAATAPNLDRPGDQTNLWRPVGITALSLGAAGLIAWGVSSAIADAKLNKCEEMAGEHWCATEEVAQPYRTARTVSAASFWTGAVLTLGGVGVLLWDGHLRASESPRLSWDVGPRGASLRGVF